MSMNKKKYIIIGIDIVILIALFSSIGGGNSSEEYTPVEKPELIIRANQTEVKGDLKGCFEVVDKDYRVKFATKSYESDIITVELKRTNKALPYDRDDVVIFPEGKESSANKCAGFGIEILDQYGDVIYKQNANATPYSWDEMTTAIQLLPEDTATIGFRFEDLSEAAGFRVTSIVMKNEDKKSAFDALDELAKEAEDIYYDEDLDDLMEDYEDALEMSKKSMELAKEMLDLF